MNAATRLTTIVICPLVFEAKAIRKAIRRAGLAGLPVVVSGPGPEAVRRAVVQAAAGSGTADRPVLVLAGVAGGLCEVDGVPRIERVVDAEGRSWACPVLPGSRPGAESARAVTVLGLSTPLASAKSKREWHFRSGAHLVDAESHAFAEACEAAGLGERWAVVRGVSDRQAESLPHQIVGWVDGAGRTRLGRALRDIVRRPSLLAAAARLGRRSSRVLPLVGQRVAELVGAAIASAPDHPPGDDRAASPADPGAPVTPLDVPTGTPLLILFGGTFDPPHRGHIELPVRIRAELERRLGLPRAAWLVYVPAARSPLKGRAPIAPDADRVAMLRLALEGVERASLWTDEIGRAGPESYTIDTLRRARAWLDGHGRAATRLRLLIGADQAAQFYRWREARAIIALAEPVIMLRPASGSEPADVPADPGEVMTPLRQCAYWSADELDQWRSRLVEHPPLRMSSTDLRARLGDPGLRLDPLERFVDPRVLAYIRAHRLYQTGRPATL